MIIMAIMTVRTEPLINYLLLWLALQHQPTSAADREIRCLSAIFLPFICNYRLALPYHCCVRGDNATKSPLFSGLSASTHKSNATQIHMTASRNASDHRWRSVQYHKIHFCHLTPSSSRNVHGHLTFKYAIYLWCGRRSIVAIFHETVYISLTHSNNGTHSHTHTHGQKMYAKNVKVKCI